MHQYCNTVAILRYQYLSVLPSRKYCNTAVSIATPLARAHAYGRMFTVGYLKFVSRCMTIALVCGVPWSQCLLPVVTTGVLQSGPRCLWSVDWTATGKHWTLSRCMTAVPTCGTTPAEEASISQLVSSQGVLCQFVEQPTACSTAVRTGGAIYFPPLSS